MENLLLENKRKVCRTCLRIVDSRKKLISIFTSDPGIQNVKISFADMLTSITNEILPAFDELPKRICDVCVQQIRSSYQFRVNAEQSYRTLLKTFNLTQSQHAEFKIKTENKTDISVMETNSQEIELTIPPGQENFEELLTEIPAPSISHTSIPDSLPIISNIQSNVLNNEDLKLVEEVVGDAGVSAARKDKGQSPDSGINEDTDHEAFRKGQEEALEAMDDKDKHICEFCDKPMFSANALNRHKKNLHLGKKCSYCKFIFTSNAMENHVHERHPDKINEFKLNGRKLSDAHIVLNTIESLNIHKCSFCQRIFLNRVAYLTHDFECVHDCQECNMNFYNESSFKQHFIKQHNIDFDYKPEKVRIYTKDEFTDKFIEKRGDSSYCKPCCSSSVVIWNHIYKHSVTPSFKCPICPKLFYARNVRLNHLSKKHPNSYRCETCKKQFTKHLLLANHSITAHKKKTNIQKSKHEQQDPKLESLRYIEHRHTNSGTVRRLEQNRTNPTNRDEDMNNVESFTFIEFKEKFLERQSNVVDTFCKICKTTSLTKNITTHCKTRHCLTMPFLCYLCGKGFTYINARTTHMQRKHPNDFVCSKCNQQFLQPSAYADHMKRVHFLNIKVNSEPKEIDVHLTNMRFTTNVPAEQYVDEQGDCEIVSIVKLDKPKPKSQNIFYRDEFIKKFMINKKGLFECSICVKKFNKTSVGSHLIHFHSIELPYKCPFCDKRFTETRSRNKHALRFHNGYKCLFCDMSFADHNGVLLHTRQNHKSSKVVARSPGEEVDLIGNNIVYAPHPHRRQFNKQENSEDENNDDNDESLPSLENELENIPETDVTEDGIETSYSEVEFIKNFTVQKGEKVKCLPCAKELMKHSLIGHMKECHSKTPPFFCELCPEAFTKYHHRPIHMKEFHSEAFRCDECNRQFLHTINFRKHMNNSHAVNIDIAPMKPLEEIEIPMENLEFMKNPYRSVQLKKSYVAESGLELKRTNDAEEFTLERFKSNFISNINDGSFLCHVCVTHVPEKNFKTHMLENHAITEFTFCEICGIGFNSELKRVKHMKQKHPECLKCDVCTIQFTRGAHLVHHMKSQHRFLNFAISQKAKKEDLPFENILFTDYTPKLKKMTYYQYFADVPDDISMTRAQFTTKFIRVHAESNTQIRCLACGRDFLESSRREHLDGKHAIVKSASCDFCPMRFHQKFFLRKHLEKKHQGNQYYCKLCNLQMLKGQEFVNHMQEVHFEKVDIAIQKNNDVPNSELRYVRNVEVWKMKDEIQSTASSDIMDDLLDFPDESIFSCTLCNQDFDSSRMLRNHKRISCPFNASTSFTDNASVKSEEQEEYSCEKCDKKFCSRSSIAGHRNWHMKMEKESSNKKLLKLEMSAEQPKTSTPAPVVAKSTDPEYECDVCDDIGARRDNMDKHMKNCHNGEFKCGLCGTISSTYILSKTHLLSKHPRRVKTEMSKRHKCPQCFRYFNLVDSLNEHIINKHEKTKNRGNGYYCEACNYVVHDRILYTKHCEHWHHRAQEELMNTEKNRLLTGEAETYEVDQVDENGSSGKSPEKPTFKYPTRRMSLIPPSTSSPMTQFNSALRKRRMSVMPPATPTSVAKNLVNKFEFPPPKPKLDQFDTPSPVPIKKEKLDDEALVKFTEPQQSTSELKSELSSENRESTFSSDALDDSNDETVYLKYMRQENGNFVCLICEKEKPLRKYLLHHLKQHKEIPTYSCSQCSLKFLFKLKYENHVKSHQSNDDEPMPDLICLDEHPKFQDPTQIPANRCAICKMSFKYVIMLNNHNNDWHAETNPDRGLTIREQRLKRKQIKEEAIKKSVIQVTQIEPNEQ